MQAEPLKLWEHVGEKITIQARNTGEMAAHALSFPGPGWVENYVVYNGYHIVVYSRSRINCPGPVRITGTVREVTSGKEPNSKSYHGYHVDAESWSCLP